MYLRSHKAALCLQILDGQILAAISIRHFVGTSARSLGEGLVPHANPKNRLALVQRPPQLLDGLADQRRVSGSFHVKYAP